MSLHGQVTKPSSAAISEGHAGLEQILGRLEVSSAGDAQAPVVALVGCQSGDGTSFVLRALAAMLARRTQKRVLGAAAADIVHALEGTTGALLESCQKVDGDHHYHFDPPEHLPKVDPFSVSQSSAHERVFRLLTSHFRYVLLDCGAVTASGHLWTFAPFIDEVLLVVAEGETKRSQISYAQRLVQQSGAHLAGCILNKRTYPLPALLYRALA